MDSSSPVVPEKHGINPLPGVSPPVKSDQLPTGKKLTKDLVLSKSKGGSLVEIKKIVVWGQKITDCSIVTEIPELEVASMTANMISSLEHFGQCPNLRELFLRSNHIGDIQEIFYLKDLPNLQVLWLAGNPCTKHPKYRSTVIRNLEQLQKLDDTEITPAERLASESDGLLFDEAPAARHADASVTDAFATGDLAERMQPAEDVPLTDGAAEATGAAVAVTKPSPLPTAPAGTAPLEDGAAEAAVVHVEKPSAVDAATTAVEATAAAAAAATTSRPITAGPPAPLPRYALTEVRTAVLHLIRLLDQESLQLVLLTVRSRLEKDFAAAAQSADATQQQQPPAGADMSTSFSLDYL